MWLYLDDMKGSPNGSSADLGDFSKLKKIT